MVAEVHEVISEPDLAARPTLLPEAMWPLVRKILDKVLRIEHLEEVYSKTKQNGDAGHFFDRVLQALQVRYRVLPSDLELVPRMGPVIVVANHPFGAIEGVVMASILRTVRADVKILANNLLDRIADLKDNMIFVDPFGNRKSVQTNARSVKEALRWLRHGGMVGIFPAGEVSHIHLDKLAVIDPKWSDVVAFLVRKTNAQVLPMYFPGANDLVFQILGIVHGKLRTVMLPNELMKKRNRIIEVRLGRPIEGSKVTRFETDRKMTDYLRQRTYLLAHRVAGYAGRHGVCSLSVREKEDEDGISPVESPTLLAQEIDTLDRKQVLVNGGQISVMCARSHQIPRVHREICRQREIAFRRVGEGTGKTLDMDRFDEYYDHLFLWDSRSSQVIGGYRLGRTDKILEQFGVQGLYTSTLFRFPTGFFDRIGPAIELGRSFVRYENQKDSVSLPLLWRGIARYVSARPQYRTLFGPVSISNTYASSAKQLMVDYLLGNHSICDNRLKVRSRRPFTSNPIRTWQLRDFRNAIDSVDELSEWVEEIEWNGSGLPVLLRHYLKLNGKILAFNVDPEFSQVIDGLVLVDLMEVDIRILERLMGKEGFASFQKCHHKTAIA